MSKLTYEWRCKFNHDFASDILKGMPEAKKESLRNALDRNMSLTSSYCLKSMQQMTVYKEGWYIELYGTRCAFKVWVSDSDGKFVYGRKPREEKLHKLYEQHFFGSNELEWQEMF